MINNARAESDAISARAPDRIEGTSERGVGLPPDDSDGEGSYEEYDSGSRQLPPPGFSKRESI